MARSPLSRLAALLVVVVWLASTAGPLAQRAATAPPPARPPAPSTGLTILQINDVYSIDPVGGAGGLARVAAVKQQVAGRGRTALLVLAGDFLSPSVASSVFKGEQMIAALNAAGLDLATLGNHEFDFGADVLIRRMHEARWQWVVSNVSDPRTGRPVGDAAPFVIRTFGALKVGFIGLCLTGPEISRDKVAPLRLTDPLQAAGRYVPVLKRQGANVIVAVTHLTLAEDRQLAARFPAIDLIVGGHEHYPIAAVEQHGLISKAGSDARHVARIDLDRSPAGVVERSYELVPVTGAVPEDPQTRAVVERYDRQLDEALDIEVGTTAVTLDADTVRLRSSETNLGDLAADAMRAATGADLALLNAGALRGDRVYPAGAVTRRTLVAMHPFGDIVCELAASGRILLAALNHGVAQLPAAAGQFLQVSGLTFRVDAGAAAGDRIRDVRVNGAPLDPAKAYTIALPDYMLTGGDGYGIFAGQRVLVSPESGGLLVTALEQYIGSRGTVTPRIEGRIVSGR